LIHAGIPPSGTVALDGAAVVWDALAAAGLAGACANAAGINAAATHVARVNFLSSIHLSWFRFRE
jgi:hypothetical protein